MGSLAWKVIGTGAAVAAASVAERGISTVWKAATGTKPPINPENPDTHWSSAVSWAVLSGAAIGVARLVATRKAAAYYRHSSGTLPKPIAAKEPKL